MRKTYNLLVVGFMLVIASCSQNEKAPQPETISYDFQEVTTTSVDIRTTREPEILLQDTFEYLNFDFVKVYGVDKLRVQNIISRIDPKYFEGITEISFVYSNKEAINRREYGWYYPDSNSIRIYVYDESDGFIMGNILHELKHHYCWMNFKDITHDKCFLDTPVDKEFGYAK